LAPWPASANGPSGATAGCSGNGIWLAGGTFGEGYVRLYEFPSLNKHFDLKCGVGKVFDLAFSPDSKFLFAMLEDGYISVINIAEKKVVTEMILYENNFLVKDSEGHYTAKKTQVNGIGLRYGSRCYPVSNADNKYNRPDIIIRKMGVTDTAVLNAYEKAYRKRLKRMKSDSKQLENITGFPEAVIRNSQFHRVESRAGAGRHRGLARGKVSRRAPGAPGPQTS
jgi:hypothetical protein